MPSSLLTLLGSHGSHQASSESFRFSRTLTNNSTPTRLPAPALGHHRSTLSVGQTQLFHLSDKGTEPTISSSLLIIAFQKSGVALARWLRG